ncbi:hypothetical protein RRU01S_04_01760 [Agrobacterium rubi TR3 = NBRC 13261]|uniref:CD-NTase-associated protein 12/Pycsar effector protein TIR domain-containing protein n=1 Tax=Agrobacterium rubi TR3 = NBRC 13261 TaxID=1368415 RepID=A0A081CRQ8_9HYPH|nr:hypothetical protein [Agrobacterium rubi]MBP1876835.1 hypothetical protein [Agrobacterium rubi]GAK69354.1 hypothetical protein RRU01S_04_01760 [Agrobacterium rubi TR3 = NBRC 13261]
MAKKTEKKTCFVVGPIGDDDTEDRIHADWLLADIIQPVFDEHFSDFVVTRADKISNPGQITSQVITALLDAELVIADLTTLNPNAFYEIGIRHTIQRPIIHVHLEGQRIPFDIAPFRSIKFSRRRPADIRAARTTVLSFVTEALNPDHQIDNPVTFSRGKVMFSETATPAEKLLQEEISTLQDRLRTLEARFQLQTNSGPASFQKKVRVRPPVLAMEVSAPTEAMLVEFLRDRLDFGFSGISLIEDNGANQVIEVPDTAQNRGAIGVLELEAKKAKYNLTVTTTVP